MHHWPMAAFICLSLLTHFAGPATADISSRTRSPYFYVESGEEGRENFPLKATAVDATINGVLADVKVSQTYANTGTRPINASYIFPASTRAAVHGMQMTVGEDVIKAQIKARQAAQKIFVKAKADGQGASLLEQQRPNVFAMQVANIMPGETVTIMLHYSELLIPEAGIYQFVYPTVAGPRYAGDIEAGNEAHHQWVENPYLTEGRAPTSRFAMTVTLAAGLPIGQMSCVTHATDVVWESEAHARIALTDSETHGGDRDFILDYRLSGDAIHSGLMLFEGETENFFMLMVQPPKRVLPQAIPAREYIFVVDVSGSMHGFPLDTAKTLLSELIGGLRPEDSFNVILFAGGARLLSPRSLPADEANIVAALELIDQQQGGGGTELRLALEKGLALPGTEGSARTMVVVTDGYIAAEKRVFRLIADNLNRSNVFTFGIGSSVNRYLIEGLAKAGQGEPFVVTEPEAAVAAARRFRTYIQAPLLAGIDIDYGAFDAYDMEPKITGDLFAQRPLVISGKWRGEPLGTVRISGHAGEGPFERQFEVSPHLLTPGSRALPYLWARTRLGRLSDFSPYEDDQTTREQVTQLGLDYNLLTAHTSFVAVHETVRNTDGPARDVDQPLPLPQGVSHLAVGGRNVPEPDLVSMLAAMMAAAAMVVLWRRRQHARQWPDQPTKIKR